MGDQFKFWFSLAIVAIWLWSAFREMKQREQIKRQREERLRTAPPASIPAERPHQPKPIEAMTEDGETAEDLIARILKGDINEEAEAPGSEDMEEVLAQEEHVMTEAQAKVPPTSAEQITAHRQTELFRLTKESSQPVGHASLRRELPTQFFPKGLPQVIIASEILQPPKALRNRNASRGF